MIRKSAEIMSASEKLADSDAMRIMMLHRELGRKEIGRMPGDEIIKKNIKDISGELAEDLIYAFDKINSDPVEVARVVNRIKSRLSQVEGQERFKKI